MESNPLMASGNRGRPSSAGGKRAEGSYWRMSPVDGGRARSQRGAGKRQNKAAALARSGSTEKLEETCKGKKTCQRRQRGFLRQKPGRSCEEPPDSPSWYQSLQTMGERFEDHVKTIDLLMKKLDNWTQDHLGALDQLVNEHVINLWEWLEQHSMDLTAWLHVYLWTLQELQHRYMEGSDYRLGKEILLHDKCWEENVSKADAWLKHPNATLYKWLEEDLMTLNKALEIQGNSVGSSRQESVKIHIQDPEHHVKMLEQLLAHYIATATKWLEGCSTPRDASSQKSAPKLGRAQATALGVKCLSVMKWLEEHVVALEQWLLDSMNWQKKRKIIT
ncbi:uncharacterized protein LOC118082796 [Zootoca vivipara]|uniref:uncharacterized protein LOC118082796 n=1 Tax=Zootoca vivipara TaxID=8524 RepID=UPI00158FBED7|nr:uncharacterized protein LOC118082796 [Zootoca vivipara]